MKSNPLLAAIYVRLSKEDEKQSNSIINQIRLIQEYIASHLDLQQYEFVTYCDDGYSGTDFLRPGIMKLLTDVRNGKIQCILVKDLSRFGRNYLEVGNYLEEVFPLLNVRFISINDNYDNRRHLSSVNSMDIAVRNLMYDYYSKDLSQKVKASFKIKQEKGYHLGGGIPYGYSRSKREKGKLEINWEEADIVKKIFIMTQEGHSRSEIARMLNESGIPSPGKVYWTLDAIIRILRNEVYIGTTINHKYKVKEIGSRKTVLLPKEEWNTVIHTHEGIVSKELFTFVQDTFRKRDTKQVRNKTAYKGLLTGKIKCGFCKYSMNLIHAKKPYYQCISHRFIPNANCSGAHADCNEIEAVILELLHILKNIFDSDTCYHKDTSGTEKAKIDKKRLEKQIHLNEVKIYDNYRNNMLSKEEYMRKREELHRKRKQLINQKEEYEIVDYGKAVKEQHPLHSIIKTIYFYDAIHMEFVIYLQKLREGFWE